MDDSVGDRRDEAGRLLRCGALVGLLVFVAIVLVEHGVRSELSPASHQISEYANGPHGWLMTLAFSAWAVSLVCAAGVLRPWPGWRPVGVALLIAAAGIGLVAAFHTQTVAGQLPPGQALRTGGMLHDIGSGAATVSLFAGALLSLRPGGTVLRRWTVALLTLAVVTDVVLLALGSEVGGIRERILVGAGCAWEGVVIARGKPSVT